MIKSGLVQRRQDDRSYPEWREACGSAAFGNQGEAFLGMWSAGDLSPLQLCSNNCPGDAIPREEFILTEGIRRWLTDVEKCYVYSRLRAEYCHLCVDVCPYVHKANDDPEKKRLYKRYAAGRKEVGYKTPTRFQDDDNESL